MLSPYRWLTDQGKYLQKRAERTVIHEMKPQDTKKVSRKQFFFEKS
jgi:hypothetical protein